MKKSAEDDYKQARQKFAEDIFAARTPSLIVPFSIIRVGRGTRGVKSPSIDNIRAYFQDKKLRDAKPAGGVQ